MNPNFQPDVDSCSYGQRLKDFRAFGTPRPIPWISLHGIGRVVPNGFPGCHDLPKRTYENTETDFYHCLSFYFSMCTGTDFSGYRKGPEQASVHTETNLNCWFSFAPVFQWWCSTPQGSPGVGCNTFLSSPHLCFIIVWYLFVSDRSKAVLLLWFIFICYHNIYNVCLLHEFVATLRLSALPSALYFVLSKLALWSPHFNSCSPCFP